MWEHGYKEYKCKHCDWTRQTSHQLRWTGLDTNIVSRPVCDDDQQGKPIQWLLDNVSFGRDDICYDVLEYLIQFQVDKMILYIMKMKFYNLVLLTTAFVALLFLYYVKVTLFYDQK